MPEYNPKSELTPDEQTKVHAYHNTQDDYKLAWEELRSLKMGLPTNTQVTMAAKLLGAFPDKCLAGGPHWLITETYLMLGEG